MDYNEEERVRAKLAELTDYARDHEGRVAALEKVNKTGLKKLADQVPDLKTIACVTLGAYLFVLASSASIHWILKHL